MQTVSDPLGPWMFEPFKLWERSDLTSLGMVSCLQLIKSSFHPCGAWLTAESFPERVVLGLNVRFSITCAECVVTMSESDLIAFG